MTGPPATGPPATGTGAVAAPADGAAPWATWAPVSVPGAVAGPAEAAVPVGADPPTPGAGPDVAAAPCGAGPLVPAGSVAVPDAAPASPVASGGRADGLGPRGSAVRRRAVRAASRLAAAPESGCGVDAVMESTSCSRGHRNKRRQVSGPG
ncbi:hypothetical protein ABZ946_19045 [Streptomyces sp. NPDC046324]|uniref:hypothetical protein n=1 Tax=Streptomyces sp. NPDC046324 TaxID=3154915 RepID=UPI0033C1A801